MKFLYQLGIILGFSFLGELCSTVLPFHLPAAIYGLVFLAAALLLKVIRLEWVRETGVFLSGLLPLLFVTPVVGLMDCWDSIAPEDLAAILVIILASTIITFGVAGFAAQMLTGKEDKTDDTADSE